MLSKLIRITTVPLSLDKLLTGQLKYMVGKGFDVYMISSMGNNVHFLEERESSTFIAVEMTRFISPIKDLVSLFKLVRVFRKLKPDIVHTHTPKAGLLGMMAARIANVPIRLHTVAGLPLMEATGMKRRLLEYTEWLTYKCAIKVYPNSTNLKEFILKSKFCSSDKLKVIGNGSSNGINTNHFKISPELVSKADSIKENFGLTESNFTFIFIGRLVKDKGIEELIQAFTSLAERHAQIRLLLVGPFEPELDPLSAECLAMIGNSNAIINVGYQDDVRPYLAISNVLVFPSYREGFPNVPMQAGCFELPAIVTDINGCNEIIANEENGLIIPPKNIDALQNAMSRLLTGEALYGKLQKNSRPMIVDRYEQKHLWSLIYREYESLLGG
ncbi:glycosyltransferase family 4 protein [Mucilaginibacter agri]|nr:glycosyltransferase family 4 protein [Mucilaginibacter agri]